MLPLSGGRAAVLEPVASRLENVSEWASADLSLLSEVATGITDTDADMAPLGRKLTA